MSTHLSMRYKWGTGSEVSVTGGYQGSELLRLHCTLRTHSFFAQSLSQYQAGSCGALQGHHTGGESDNPGVCVTFPGRWNITFEENGHNVWFIETL